MLVDTLPPVRCRWASYERVIVMAIPKHDFVVDDDGKKKAVILDIAEYRRLLEEAEELEAIRAYDAAKAAGDEAIPFEQAVSEIERDRE
jgi:hypothetical protein